MEALWISLALVVAVIGGWPLTAGILKFARSSTVRAVDAAETGARAPGDPASELTAEPSTGPESNPALDSTTEAAADADSEIFDVEAHREDFGEHDPGSLGTAPSRPKIEVLRGGLLIGFLERAAVAVAIFSGQPVAIAYVVAIKGLGRYPELKDTPAASERFIIGTLASMLWSASVAVLVKVLLL